MPRILVVDDEKGVRESLKVLLSEEGYLVDLADDGTNALTMMSKESYDLVLTDIRMPQMDGMALLKEIKEKWNEDIPVIFITAYGAIQSAVSAVKEGASDFITKPFEIERLRQAVKIALKNKEDNYRVSLMQQRKKNSYMQIMNQKLDRAIFELAILHEIGKIVNSTLELKKIVSIVLEMARQAINADRSRLFLWDAESREKILDLSYSIDDHCMENFGSLEQYAIHYVMDKREPLLMADIDKLDYFKSIPGASCGLNSLIVVPFIRKERVIGIMFLAKLLGQEKFNGEDFKFIKTMTNQVSIAIENAQLYGELQDHFADTIRALITAVETKDTYTFGHSDRVTRYSLMIANQLGISHVESRRLEYLALLHDIGKIGITEKILQKPSRLNEQEWHIVKNHAELGASIVKPIKFLQDGEKTIRHHHEWFNGGGYPDGLEGEAIPIFSRIIAVADAFDAMTSMRPYRDSMGIEAAIKELQKNSGKQFDPLMVDLFINAYQEEVRTTTG